MVKIFHVSPWSILLYITSFLIIYPCVWARIRQCKNFNTLCSRTWTVEFVSHSLPHLLMEKIPRGPMTKFCWTNTDGLQSLMISLSSVFICNQPKNVAQISSCWGNTQATLTVQWVLVPGSFSFLSIEELLISWHFHILQSRVKCEKQYTLWTVFKSAKMPC